MATPDQGGSFLGEVLAWVAAGIAGVGAWLWSNTMGRIAKLEESKVNQKTFDEYVFRAEKDRSERRETEIKLFGEVKDLRNHIDAKIDRLADMIRDK